MAHARARHITSRRQYTTQRSQITSKSVAEITMLSCSRYGSKPVSAAPLLTGVVLCVHGVADVRRAGLKARAASGSDRSFTNPTFCD
eukprot:2365975-Prymnesium_polylepis.1